MSIGSIYILQALEFCDLQLRKISYFCPCERLSCTSNIDSGNKWSLEIGYAIQKQLQNGMAVKIAQAQGLKGDPQKRGENKHLQI